MCRGQNFCSELSDNPTDWDTNCPLPKPKHFSIEIDNLQLAIQFFINGKVEKCLDVLRAVPSKEITEWYIEHGQMSGRIRNIIIQLKAPEIINSSLRDSIRSPRKLQNQVFIRDGYRCRYCGNRLINQDLIRLFSKKINSSIFQKGKTNLTTNGIIHMTWPVADHVIPWNQGGKTNLENLVSSCAPCNYGKDGYTIEQIGISNPFNRKPIIDGWNGLNDELVLLEKI
tara:strand:+ start:15739 stop:16419 length:681 start_codon:yes stop_codon:yes gene_type:complete